MLFSRIGFFGLFLVLFSSSLMAQRIVYSQPSEDDSRRMNFEIMGKVSGNFLVYKHTRGKNFVSIYNASMEETSRVEQDYIPDDRLINIEFFPYQDFTYLVYQYQRKGVVYCDAAKVDGNGKKVGEVMSLDTTHLNGGTNNRVYSVISSENKSKLMLFKINSRNKSRFIITTMLFNQDLALQKRSRFVMPMEERDDQLDEFHVDNDGDLVFAKLTQNNNENITQTSLMWKGAQSDTLMSFGVPHEGKLLDKLYVKVDNNNKRYFLTSFYYAKKRGNIEGFYFFVWDKQTRQPVLQNAVTLSDQIREDAKGNATNKTAFNDYFVRNVIIKRNGGFVINTESYYTTSRGGSWNRWNYLYGSPFSTYDYYSVYSPYSNWWWRDRYGSPTVRHHSDNITILSFDPQGKLEWSGVIHKEQFDDETDDRISYLAANTGSQIHYLFNTDERRTLLLTDYTLSPDGKLNPNTTLKNLDRGYEFMPKFGKQVSSNQLIVPCYYRNYICFAKIEFN